MGTRGVWYLLSLSRVVLQILPGATLSALQTLSLFLFISFSVLGVGGKQAL